METGRKEFKFLPAALYSAVIKLSQSPVMSGLHWREWAVVTFRLLLDNELAMEALGKSQWAPYAVVWRHDHAHHVSLSPICLMLHFDGAQIDEVSKEPSSAAMII